MRIGVEDIPALVSRVSDCARGAGLAPARVLDVQLAVEEILANVLFHGYEEPIGDIELSCEPDRESCAVVVTIADWGRPFDIRNAPEPDRKAELESRLVGGLGVSLVRFAADEIHYALEDGRNVVRLVFRNRSN